MSLQKRIVSNFNNVKSEYTLGEKTLEKNLGKLGLGSDRREMAMIRTVANFIGTGLQNSISGTFNCLGGFRDNTDRSNAYSMGVSAVSLGLILFTGPFISAMAFIGGGFAAEMLKYTVEEVEQKRQNQTPKPFMGRMGHEIE
jgi:hypothetical protein